MRPISETPTGKLNSPSSERERTWLAVRKRTVNVSEVTGSKRNSPRLSVKPVYDSPPASTCSSRGYDAFRPCRFTNRIPRISRASGSVIVIDGRLSSGAACHAVPNRRSNAERPDPATVAVRVELVWTPTPGNLLDRGGDCCRIPRCHQNARGTGQRGREVDDAVETRPVLRESSELVGAQEGVVAGHARTGVTRTCREQNRIAGHRLGAFGAH